MNKYVVVTVHRTVVRMVKHTGVNLLSASVMHMSYHTMVATMVVRA